MVLTAISQGLGLDSSSNTSFKNAQLSKHLRSKRATKGWWVGLSSSLGMFADDEEEHELMENSDDSDDDGDHSDKHDKDNKSHKDNKDKHKSHKSKDNKGDVHHKMREGYIDDAEREVTTALLAARANVSVTYLCVLYFPFFFHSDVYTVYILIFTSLSLSILSNTSLPYLHHHNHLCLSLLLHRHLLLLHLHLLQLLLLLLLIFFLLLLHHLHHPRWFV